jgi:hypothetical protein
MSTYDAICYPIFAASVCLGAAFGFSAGWFSGRRSLVLNVNIHRRRCPVGARRKY